MDIGMIITITLQKLKQKKSLQPICCNRLSFELITNVLGKAGHYRWLSSIGVNINHRLSKPVKISDIEK
jgi:hypothetical protein